MHTFRYNPVAKQWVLLGDALPHELRVSEAHRLDAHQPGPFFAASYPESPFQLEPGEALGRPAGSLLYAERPPVGEYELLLYGGAEPIALWRAQEWEGWLRLVQQRLSQLYHNPHLHYATVSLRTGLQHTAQPYLRAGDLVASSHPVSGQTAELSAELAGRLAEREQAFILHADRFGTLLAASAPTLADELWYLPATAHPGFETQSKEARHALAETLASLMSRLRTSERHYAIRLHTSLQASSDLTWWLQIYHDMPMHAAEALPLQRLPELLVRELREEL